MKNRNKLLLAITFFTFNSLIGFSQSKETTDFKTIKKSIDTLTIFTNSYVEAVGPTETRVDSILELKNSDRISKKVFSILKSKYSLVNAPFKLNKEDLTEVNEFFSQFDSPQKSLSNIEIPRWLHSRYKNDQGRYILAVFHSGYYNTEYKPHYQINRALSTNTIPLSSLKLNGTRVHIIIADTLTNKILFYTTDKSNSIDPRVPTEIEPLISKLIRPIYYK